MVYGEKKREAEKNAKYRIVLVKEKVKDCSEYYHVGVKNCLFGKSMTEDVISHSHRAFNAITIIGIKS